MLLVTTLGGSKVFKSSLLFAPANGKRGLGLLYGGRTLAGLGVGGASNLTLFTFLNLHLQQYGEGLLVSMKWDGRLVVL